MELKPQKFEVLKENNKNQRELKKKKKPLIPGFERGEGI